MEVGKTRTPPLAANIRALIPEMNRHNPTWGEERIANELKLKLGISVSPRTIRKYIGPQTTHRLTSKSLRWSTFVRNHSKAVLASDFFQSVTATFRVVYVFVAMRLAPDAFCIAT